jgi:hypothetical protein
MLKDEIKKKIKKNLKKWTELIYQTHDPGHKTKLTSWKTNRNKLRISIPNQLNIKGWD